MVDRGDYACLDCRFCLVDMGSPNYSEVTPGAPACWECEKRVWILDADDHKADVAKALDTGRTCDKFEPEDCRG